MKSIALATLLALAPSFLQAPALAQAPAAPPAQLALNDLVNRPDRLPPAVTLKRAFDFGGGQSAKVGQSVKVLEFNGSEVVVDAGNDLLFGVAPGDCDLVEAANKAWAALTPAQRAVDVATVLADSSLWPEKVTCHAAFELNSGAVLPGGTEYDFLTADANGVRIFAAKEGAALTADLSQTDLIARARQRALVEPEKRAARLPAALKGALVDIEGKPLTGDGYASAKVFVLYYGASWCGPCRKFSPTLVDFANKSRADNPGLAFVLMSNDQDPKDMLGYMKEEKMPWPALPLEKLKKSPLFMGYTGQYIPLLVVVDRYGKVLASSVDASGNYTGTAGPFQELTRLVQAGAAK